tara:strand:+ start:198 stop:479 length:282 start_codon:yes stop_codon:yes gene_type:complete
MKKTAIAIAVALTIGVSASDNVQKEHKVIEYTTEDLIDGIRQDMYYGYITQDRAEYYIKQLLKIKSVNRDAMVEFYKMKKETNKATIMYNHYE